MHKFTAILLLLALLLPRMAICQTIQLQIADKTTGEGIGNAHIIYSGKRAISDSHGQVTLEIPTKISIRISHISYCDTSFYVRNINQSILVELVPKINTLPEMQVDAKPVTLFAPARTHVFDFEFWNDSLLVMTYKKEKLFRRGTDQCQTLYLGCKLLLISPSGSIIDSLPLPDLIQGFYKDPLQQVFILGDNLVRLIDFKLGRLSLSKMDSQEFEVFIKPLDGSSNTTYFFNDYEWDYPEFSYYGLSKNSDKKYVVRTIRDDFTMELFRAEYKYLSKPDKLRALRLEDKTGIDKEVFGAYMSGFAHHVYYQKLYAPLFNYGDSLFIFDHHSSQVFLHDGNGVSLDSTEIHYHQNRALKFKDEIISDVETKSFYGIFEKSGIKALREIDPISGESQEIINLYYTYPEKIKVRDHKVYYIYRKTGGSSTKHLFVEGI